MKLYYTRHTRVEYYKQGLHDQQRPHNLTVHQTAESKVLLYNKNQKDYLDFHNAQAATRKDVESAFGILKASLRRAFSFLTLENEKLALCKQP